MKKYLTYYLAILFQVLMYININAQWVTQISNVTVTLQSTYFVNETQGFAVGSNKILKTTDSGATWNVTDFNPTNLRDIYFIDETTGWICGGGSSFNAMIAKTTNGGTIWASTNFGALDVFYSIYFVDQNTGYCVGKVSGPEWSYLYKTTNGGINWFQIYSTDPDPIVYNSVHFIDDSLGFLVGQVGAGGQIARTTDGGSTWSFTNTPLNLKKIYFVNDTHGWIAGNNGTVMYSIDAGVNWTNSNTGTTENLNSIYFTDVNYGFAVGNNGTILSTSNGGNSWIEENIVPPTTSGLASVHFPTSIIGWAVGANGTILKRESFIIVASPNGGETWVSGNPYEITWTDNIGENVKIELYKGGVFNSTIIGSTPSDGLYSWPIPISQVTGNDYKVRITSVNTGTLYDESNSNFRINQPSITVTAPLAGVTWTIGSNQTVAWSSSNVTGNVNIKLSTNGGNTYPVTLTANAANDGTESITVPNNLSTTCRIKVESVDNINIFGVNPGDFTIVATSYITIILPNGGEQWISGNQYDITWEDNIVENVKLELYKGGVFESTIVESTNSDGTYTWTIPMGQISGNDYKVRITSVNSSSLYDESNSTFTISQPSITVSAPLSSATWTVGSNQSVEWSSGNVTGNVNIKLSTDGGSTYPVTLTANTANDGTESITVPNNLSTTCRIKVESLDNINIFGVNPGNFTITDVPSITVTIPLTGVTWTVGSNQLVEWSSGNVTGNVNIKLSTDGGTTYPVTLTANTANDGTENIVVPDNVSTTCRVKVESANNTSIYGENPGNFTITNAPNITVVSPNGGENWQAGTAHDLMWTSNGVANVKIEYSTNSGGNWTNIISSTSSSMGSYSWTVPNISSSNCILLISDANNTTINDHSDNVFTIFTYSSNITINTNYTFGDQNNRRYQIIGIPGDNDKSISNYIPGAPGKNNDWRAFWDPGADSYIEYNGTSLFDFKPGRAFWIISKNQITVSDNVNAVPLEPDNSFSIPLTNKEWNLISNPFNKSIPWNSIQTVNNVTQPIHFYQSGSYINPLDFEPYKGYYFFNDSSLGMSSLKIPYFTTYNLPKNNSVNLTDLEIILSSNAVEKALINVGVSEDAEQGKDMLDIFSPPSQFCEISMSLYNNELETNYKYLQKDYRPGIGEGQEYNIVIKNTSHELLELVTRGLENFSEYEIYLLDKSLMKLYNLREQNKIEVKSNIPGKEYNLFIGTEEYILKKKFELIPTEFSLNQNYPNPFNPSTTIMFALPHQSKISLGIYNILGELVAELINDQLYEEGYHKITFDGSLLSSGVYIYRIQAVDPVSGSGQGFTGTKKMILMK